MRETDFDGEEVVVQVHTGAPGERYAVVVPRSIKNMSRLQREPFADLQRVGDQLEQLENQARELAEECRRAGVSWSAVGFALGITGEGARLRYGADLGLL